MPMYGDELTMVYDTYSLLKTGQDATGESFPLTFRMGAGRPGGYVYASLPFVYLFGPSEWGVRSLSVLSGLGIIILMYFLGRKIFSEKVALIGSFLTSISLWDIYLSRGGFEAHFGLFLALLGITLFLYRKYIPWAISWGLAILTYPTFKLTLPILFFLLVWYVGIKELFKKKFFVISIIILIIFGFVSINETLKGRSEERFLRINIFSDREQKELIIQKVNSERNFSTLPDSFKQLFYNRPLEYSKILLTNYFENLSFDFLYLKGDGNPRGNPGEWGMFYLVEMLLLVIGIISLKGKDLIFLLGWILITPLATMLLGQAHGLRNALMLPPFILISSYALSQISFKWRIIIGLGIFIEMILVLQRVYYLAPNKFATFWSKEAKSASLEALNKSAKGEEVILLTNIDNIEYAYPVYARIDPRLVITQYGKFPKKYGNVIIADKNEEN